jgi:hypothetical protein
MKHRCAVAALLATLVTASLSLAQSEDSAVAQSLFDDAKALMNAGRVAEACPKLEESQRLEPRSGTLINLASCYEQAGRLASAWSKYLEAASAAKNAGNSEREAVARERAAALAPRIPKLVVEVSVELQGVPGLEIWRDRVFVGKPQWGAALPADAGEHEITASAPGREPFRAKVDIVGEGQTTTVKVVGLAELNSSPAPVVARAPERVEAPRPTKPAPAPSRGFGTMRVAALVAGGVGLVGVGVGSAFGIASKGHRDEAQKYCEGPACTDARGVTEGNAAQRDGNVATALMVVGGIGLAAGATLWLMAPARDSGAPTAQLGLSPGSLQLRGSF